MSMKNKNIVYLLMILAIFPACAGDLVNKHKQSTYTLQDKLDIQTPPLWVLGKEHPNFSTEHFVVGRGISKENSVSAAENARTDLAKTIKVNIRSKMMDFSSNRWTRIESLVESEVETVLEGVEIRDGWFDESKGNYHAFAIMNRKLASENLQIRIKLVAEKINSLFDEGVRETKGNDFSSALSSYTYGYLKAGKVEPLIAMFNIINRNTKPIKAFQAPNQQVFESKAKNLLNNMSILAISGNQQRVRLSKTPTKPFVIKVVSKNEYASLPLKGIPIQFEYLNKGGILVEDDLTDRLGIARTMVKKINSYNDINHKISASINLSKIVPNINKNDLPRFFEKLKFIKAEFNIDVEKTNDLSTNSNLLMQKMFSLAKQITHNLKPNTNHILGIFNLKNLDSGQSTQAFSNVLRKDFEDILSGVEGFTVREIRYPDQSKKDKTKIAMSNNLDIYITGGYRILEDNIEIRARLLEAATNNILGSGKISIRKQYIYPETYENQFNMNSFLPGKNLNENYNNLNETLIDIKPEHPSFDLKVSTDKVDYHVGEKLSLFVETSMSCFLTLLDFSPDGIVTVLYPNGNHLDNLILPNKTYKIPPNISLGQNKPFSLIIQKPSGLDRIKAFCDKKKTSPLNFSFKDRNDYHTIDPKKIQGKKDLKSLIESFMSNRPDQWTEAYNEVYIFDKSVTYMRGKITIPILEKPEKPMDMIGSFGNEAPAPKEHGVLK